MATTTLTAGPGGYGDSVDGNESIYAYDSYFTFLTSTDGSMWTTRSEGSGTNNAYDYACPGYTGSTWVWVIVTISWWIYDYDYGYGHEPDAWTTSLSGQVHAPGDLTASTWHALADPIGGKDSYIGNLSVTGISYSSGGPAGLKTTNGLAKASVKSVNGLTIASVKSWNGLA